MKQQLRDLLRGEIRQIDIDETYRLPSARNQMMDVRAVGEVRNEGGKLLLRLQLTGSEMSICDRCLADAKINHEIDYYEVIEDIDTFDLRDVVSEEVLAADPTQVLCSTDCKGLCPDCGTDLNKRSCQCHEQKTDPRLDELKRLFNE